MKRSEMIEAILQLKFPGFDEVLRTFGMDDREDADARELSEEVGTARAALEAMSDDDLEMELEAGEPARLLRLRDDELTLSSTPGSGSSNTRNGACDGLRRNQSPAAVGCMCSASVRLRSTCCG